MNTDKLMELERKWREEAKEQDTKAENSKTEYSVAVHESAAYELRGCADELAAALRAEQAVGEEQIARELLAEEYERVNMEPLAKLVRNGHFDLAIPAIRRALGTARQSDDAEPFGWIDAEEMARHNREGTGGGIVCGSYSERYGRTTPLYLHPARQSEGMVLEGVFAPRYVADGPEGMFGTDDLELAGKLIARGADDPDEWTVTDLTETGIEANKEAAAPGGEGEE